MTTIRRVLSFDIGIKNLAYCIAESGTPNIIHMTDNCCIIPTIPNKKCTKCGNNASYVSEGAHFVCKRHILHTHPIIHDLSDNPIIALPKLTELIKIAKKYECVPPTKSKTRQSYIDILSTKFSIPIEKETLPPPTVDDIHNGIRQFIEERWETLFSNCTHILIENQPAFKNPKMKTVQIILYTVLREKFIQYSRTTQSVQASFHFIHAKKKVIGAEKGDAGYAERKRGAEIRVQTSIQSGNIRMSTCADLNWTKPGKKSDMADTICMCMDFMEC